MVMFQSTRRAAPRILDRASDARFAPLSSGPLVAEDRCMATVLVKHLMTTPVISFFEEQTLPLADDVMRLKHVRHLPVVDERQHLVGIISHRDLLAAQLSNQTGMSHDVRNAVQANVRIGQIMTRDVWTVQPEVPAAVAATTLLAHKFGCLPVVDQSGVLVGILTEHDVLRFAIKVMSAT